MEIPAPLLIAYALGVVLTVGHLDRQVSWTRLTPVAWAGMLMVVTLCSLLFPLTWGWILWLRLRS